MIAWSDALEPTAVVLGLGFTLLAGLGYSISWWFGMISSALYVVMAWLSGYYLDVVLNVFYVLAAFYGLWSWKQPGQNSFKVPKLPKNHVLLWWTLPAPLGVLVGWLVGMIPSASLPLLDGMTTFYAFAGTYLLAKKQKLGWAIFVPVDLVMAAMYAYKEWHFAALHFLLLTALAIFAWMRWEKDGKKAN